MAVLRRPATSPARAPGPGPGQLPQLRQPGAPRGDVAVRRGDGRDVRGAAGPSGMPVIGGNVSFYDESGGADIDPHARRRGRRAARAARPPAARGRWPPGARSWSSGDHGGRARRLGVGRRCRGPHDRRAAGGRPRPRAPRWARRRRWSARGRSAGIHDCSDGGLAVALAEMAVAGGCCFEVAAEGGLAAGLGAGRGLLLGVGQPGWCWPSTRPGSTAVPCPGRSRPRCGDADRHHRRRPAVVARRLRRRPR